MAPFIFSLLVTAAFDEVVQEYCAQIFLFYFTRKVNIMFHCAIYLEFKLRLNSTLIK